MTGNQAVQIWIDLVRSIGVPQPAMGNGNAC